MESATIRPLAERPRSKAEYLTLLAIVVLGAAIRLYGLTLESLWSDEAYSAYAATRPTLQATVDFVSTDVHPPGFPIALWLWGQAIGQSDWSFRLFVAIGGICFIPATFRLANQLFGARTGLVAAFLTAMSIQAIYFSQEVRAYSWVATLSVLAVSFAIDYAQRPTWSRTVLIAAITALLATLHYFGLMLAVLLWLALFLWNVRIKSSKMQPIVGFAITSAAIGPWIPIALASLGKENWIPRTNARFVAELVNVYYGPGWMLDLLALSIIGAGAWVGIRRLGWTCIRKELGLVAWILLPLSVALAISFSLRPIYSPRNMLIAAGAAFTLLARAITLIGPSARSAAAIALALVAANYTLHWQFGREFLFKPAKQQLREAAAFVDTNNRDGLPIYVMDWDWLNFEYYLRNTDEVGRIRRILSDDVREKGLAAVIPDDEFWIASAGIDVRWFADIEERHKIQQRGEFKMARAYLLKRKQ